MTILYINDEHCTSMEQLRGYFEETPSYDSPLFYDLLDYAYSGDISSWLREKGEAALADLVDGIDGKLGDCEYFSRLSALITGKESILDSLEKPAFSKCFQVEDVRQEKTSEGMEVQVLLKVLSSVNETYEFCVRTSWGQKGDKVNPFQEKKDGILTVPFKFRKRPNVDFKVVGLLADGNELEYKKSTRLDEEVLEFKVGSCHFKMIRVEHGTFKMGDNENSDAPTHEVTLTRDYYIGETVVTNELIAAVLTDASVASELKDIDSDEAKKYMEELKSNPNFPFVNTDWYAAKKVIRLMKKITGEKFDLPTEAEWEYAARGGKKSENYLFSGSDDLDDVAWYNDNSDDEMQDVADKEPNELGIYDMSGLVGEWCSDWYDEDYYDDSPLNNPKGPKEGYHKVIRGGSISLDDECGTCWRGDHNPRDGHPEIGFRLVLRCRK